MNICQKVFSCICAAMFSLAPLVQAAPFAPLKFDFGAAESPIFPGFTGVSDNTSYTSESTFGFIGTPPDAYNRVRPNALEGDFVQSKTKSTFRVDLPNGKYMAWFAYGDSRYGQRDFRTLAKKNLITINGQGAVSDPLSGWQEFYSEKYFFRGYNYVYHANDDFYDKFVAPNFKEVTTSFEVCNGQALFELEDVPLCAMQIYASTDSSKAKSDIDSLHQQMRRSTLIHEVKPNNLNPDPTYSAADKAQGYVIYSRFPSKPPLPSDRPLPSEMNTTPSTFLSIGQKANLSLSILPLQDLKNVKVTCSDLIDKTSGAKIPAIAVKVDYIALQQIAQRSAATVSTTYNYQVEPIFIKPFPANFNLMDKGVNRTILLTVTADQKSKPGIYGGTLTITPQNSPAKRVPLKVRILPINLPPLSIPAGRYAWDYDFNYYYYLRHLFTEDSFRDFVWARQKMRMQWVKDMGLNSIALVDDMQYDILSNPIRLKPDGRFIRWMDLYRDMGMKAMPWFGFKNLIFYSGSNHNPYGFEGSQRFSPEWTAKYRQLIENIRDTGKARNWPEIIFYLSDELSNEGSAGVEEGLKRIAASDGISDIRRISSVNGKYEHALIGKEDIIMPNFAFPITESTLEEMQAKKSDLWLYNVGDYRFTWGYYVFRTGAKGRFQWYQNSGMGFPFDDFDSTWGDSNYSAFVAGPNGPVSEVYALDTRDGLDDFRYLTLLKSLMEKTKNPQIKAMQDSNAILKDINAIDVDLRNSATGNLDPQATTFDAGSKVWSQQACERMRWRIAECIMELQKSK